MDRDSAPDYSETRPTPPAMRVRIGRFLKAERDRTGHLTPTTCLANHRDQWERLAASA